MFTNLVLVGAGGFLGSISRYLVCFFIQQTTGPSQIPYGTLAVNVIGCLLIGMIAGLAETREFLTAEIRSLTLVGFLGGFTTFSTFAFETASLASDGKMVHAFSNITLQLVLGLGAAWLSYAFFRQF